jgi:hypothetical protein
MHGDSRLCRVERNIVLRGQGVQASSRLSEIDCRSARVRSP